MFKYPDDFGIKIYEKLKKLNKFEVVNGGVGGLNLLTYFEDNKKILIIDYAKDMPKILTKKDIKNIKVDKYDHANALIYLLKSVENEYLVYCCNEEYKDLDFYIKDILGVINEYF